MNHFGVCMAHKLNCNLFRHTGHCKHADIFVPEWVPTHRNFPISIKLTTANTGRWKALHTGAPSIIILLRGSARMMPRCPRSARMCLFAWIGAMLWACRTGRKTLPLHGPRIGGPQNRSILMPRWPREGSPAAGLQDDYLPGAIAIARARV